MGTFSTQIDIGPLDRKKWERLDALVDTGASASAVPASLLRELGVEPLFRQSFTYASGQVQHMDMGQMWLRLGEREIITLVLFNDEGSEPLLGALALEGMFLGVDPVGQKLVPVGGLMA